MEETAITRIRAFLKRRAFAVGGLAVIIPLLVIIFLLSLFMLAQYFVSKESGRKDTALGKLNLQIAELTSLLSLEKGKSRSLEDELASIQATLAAARAEVGVSR